MASSIFRPSARLWSLTTAVLTMLSVVATYSLTASCKRDEKFPSLENNFATPTDVAADSTGNFFFVLNSDDTRDYNTGSIITLTKDGEKVGVSYTQRLGRSINVTGNDMLVTFADSGEGTGSKLALYDVSNPKAVSLAASWPLDQCNPINAVMRNNYKYFVVSCANGQIFIGELATPRSSSQLKLVRKYPTARRALYLDTTRNLLLAFPTDLRSQVLSDSRKIDAVTYADTDEELQTNTPNEIPDDWESSRAQRRNKGRRGIYQYAVYDIGAEASKQFPYVEDYTTVISELRWLYFDLSNFDGSPDIQVTDNTTDLTTRYYRTNFWEAKPNPTDDDSFYLSHRGTSSTSIGGSPHANSIIKVSIQGDLKATSATVAPKTEDVLSFERVYGFKGELEPSGKHFPCDFEIAMVKGSPLLMVNHFRDIKNFPASTYASLASKVIGNNGWFSEITEAATGHSYYQVAMTSSGRAMAVSFFQNIVILLDAAPGTAITEIKTIN